MPKRLNRTFLIRNTLARLQQQQRSERYFSLPHPVTRNAHTHAHKEEEEEELQSKLLLLLLLLRVLVVVMQLEAKRLLIVIGAPIKVHIIK